MTTEVRMIAVVTGANRGIGRELVSQLAGRGEVVVLGARSLPAGERAAREIAAATERAGGCSRAGST